MRISAIRLAEIGRFSEPVAIEHLSGGLDVLPEILPSGVVGVTPAGFPITLFLAADRTLVALHAGFPAADAGAEFHRVTTEFRATIETLLARQPTKATKATRD